MSVGREVVDAHVHFWDPGELHYPWLDGLTVLDRAFLPPAYASAAAEIPITQIVVVEGNCRSEEARREVEFVERLAETEPRIAGIVAFADLGHPAALDRALDALASSQKVRGVRQNIQAQPPGFDGGFVSLKM